MWELWKSLNNISLKTLMFVCFSNQSLKIWQLSFVDAANKKHEDTEEKRIK